MALCSFLYCLPHIVFKTVSFIMFYLFNIFGFKQWNQDANILSLLVFCMQIWARNNKSAKTWPCFRPKGVVYCIIVTALYIFVVSSQFRHWSLNIFWFSFIIEVLTSLVVLSRSLSIGACPALIFASLKGTVLWEKFSNWDGGAKK